jgi:Carbohydrate-selective porin, OprB family
MEEDHASTSEKATHCQPWNNGKLVGAKPLLRPSHVWSIRTKQQIEGRKRNLALFNLAIDGKLRDRWCVAYFNYELSKDLTSAVEKPPFNINIGREEGIEAYYNIALTPWSRVTGNLQFIDPFPSANDKSVFGALRTQARF